MDKRLQSFLQFLVIICLTAGLLWFSLRGLVTGKDQNSLDILLQTWNKSDKVYLWLMASVAILSHVLRAQRWRMLLAPSGNFVSLQNSFLSLMIGYLVNLVVPRGGEVSRCYNLFKLEKIPVETSFGTVIVERMVDVLLLLLLLVISFFVEWSKLEKFISTLDFSSGPGFKIPLWFIVAVILGIAGLLALFLLRKNEKLKKLLVGFTEGLLSIFRLKNKTLFIFYSITIWALYFFMSYLVLKAFPETSELGFSAVISLFAVGSIAMAVPLPGGTGSYHTLVPLVLVMLYNLPKQDAITFTFIFHAWQTFIMIVVGILSLLISYGKLRWSAAKLK
jgi:glycosyltransferase 2 family protein